MSSKKLIVSLSVDNYSMEVDIRKKDCTLEKVPHWHLCYQGRRVGQFSVDGQWITLPEVDPLIIHEAGSLTKEFSDKIRECYEYNSEHGFDC